MTQFIWTNDKKYAINFDQIFAIEKLPNSRLMLMSTGTKYMQLEYSSDDERDRAIDEILKEPESPIKIAAIKRDNERMEMLLRKLVDAPYMDADEAKKFLYDVQDEAEIILKSKTGNGQ